MSRSKTPPGVHLLTGNDALSKLIDVYMDGVATGYASALVLAGADEAQADHLTAQATRSMRADPLAMDMVATEVQESLQGVYSGPKNMTTGGQA